jgi:hypothetical protein
MSRMVPELTSSSSIDRGDRIRLVFGVLLTSFSALLLELSLTRLFSVILFYHFAFLAISLALLGLGAGGVFACIRRSWLGRYEIHALGSLSCGFNALAIVAVLLVVLHVPVSLQLDGINALKLAAIYFCSAVPFFFSGLLFSTVFARESRRTGMLYAADLIGGALACLALVPLLNLLGGPNTVLVSALTMASASAIWSRRGAVGRKRGVPLVTALFLLILANQRWSFIDVVYAKGVKLSRVAKVEFVRWNAFARVEVNQKPDHSKWIVLDADANSALVNVSPRSWQGPWEKDLMSAPPALANVLRPHGEFAIIGPGGGVDILRAVASGSENVVGIEINPIIANTIMRGRYLDYSFGHYKLPQVHIVVGDGRSFIRSAAQRFDVVQMTLVDTWASTAAGAMALSENYLYTMEAFQQYFDHLKRDGFIAVTRWEFREPREALRVVSVAMEALHRLGVPNPARNLIVVSKGPLNEDGRPVVVLAKRSAFTPQEQSQVQAHVAANPDLSVLYSPSESGQNAFHRIVARNDPSAFAATYAYDVSPVTDDSPFFFFTLRSGDALKSLVTSHRGMDRKINLGVAMLGIVTLISVIAVLLFLILPLAVQRAGSRRSVLQLMYFVAVGLGYILVEISFVQRFVLFLGSPTYALTVVIFFLLLSSGIGSWASRRYHMRPRALRAPSAAIACMVIIDTLLLSRLSSVVGLPFGLKLLVTASIIAPIGFLMGMPFPLGLRALAAGFTMGPEVTRETDWRDNKESGTSNNVVEWAWALNAGASVLGSDLAIVTAVHLGLKVTLALGGTAYVIALLMASQVGRGGATC